MPRYVLSNPSKLTIRRRRIVVTSSVASKIIRRYINCVCRDKEYKVGSNSDSYTEYISIGYSYKLAFLEVKLRYI